MELNPTILLVDDSPLFRETLREIINMVRPEWEVLEAANGAEGVELAQAHLPDLILLDLNMPVMDGYDAATHLRAHPQTHALPVVLMTSEDSDDPFVVRLRALCQGFLAKPFSLRELSRLLDRFAVPAQTKASEAEGLPFLPQPLLGST
jgi:two-component system cell cycle response regulator DivK